MDSLRRLEEIFSHFPGIGPRQARRFVYHLLNKSPASIKEFTDLVEEVKRGTAECDLCHRFFLQADGKAHRLGPAGQVCRICSDASRDRTTLMVVSRDSDYETVEKSGAYRGLYFVLGGTVPVLDKEPEKRIRLKALLERISDAGAGSNESVSHRHASALGRVPFKEIILSLNTTPDGEHTTDIVKESIEKMFEIAQAGTKTELSAGSTGAATSSPEATLYLSKVSVLGRGLSTGAELEYADGETIKNALRNRG